MKFQTYEGQMNLAETSWEVNEINPKKKKDNEIRGQIILFPIMQNVKHGD